MSNLRPPYIVLSGRVHDGKISFGLVGDVRIYPSRNKYIDGTIFDGVNWRRLDLNSFGASVRTFGERSETGNVMRGLASSIMRRRGCVVYDRGGSYKTL